MTISNTDPNARIAAFGDRLFRLLEETKQLGEDKKELMLEVKQAGISAKDVRAYAKAKAGGQEKFQEESERLDKIASLLGWLE
jgi:uncharacterized protein (UPF0335 family)